MPIVNSMIESVADTSNLNRMFGVFCAYVFECRDNIFENHRIKTTNSVINNVNNDYADTNVIATEKQLDTASTSLVKDADYTNDFRIIHKNVCTYLKSAISSEKISSFHKDTKEIIYAMAAIADEVFLNMEWSGKKFWELNMIESKFFGTQIAGDEIYNRIDAILSDNDPLSTEKAEIYIKMLSLGFKGKFRGSNDETIAINTYRNRIFDFVLQNDKTMVSTNEYRIFQKEYTYTMPTMHRKLLPDGSFITYISMFFVFMFFVISTLVWFFETKDMHALLSEIANIALREYV